MRLNGAMWNRRKVAYSVAIVVAGALLVGAGAVTAIAVSAGNEALREDLDAALVLRSELGARDATIAELRGQVDKVQRELEGEVEELNADLLAETEARAKAEAEAARLREVISDAGITTAQLIELENRYEALVAQFTSLQGEYAAASLRLTQLVPIESSELPRPVLYLDRAVTEVAVTRPLCSGSMEPTITCDDLLILHTPASPTDLDEGDIIYFRKPNSGCSSTLEGCFTLPRIVNVISDNRGLLFQTKGDALANPDVCLVPADDVLFELRTTVRNGRVNQ